MKRTERNAQAAEAVRLARLRADARRGLSANLAETISLSHELIKLAASTKPGRDAGLR